MNPEMTLDELENKLKETLGEVLISAEQKLGELTVVVHPESWTDIALQLRDEFGFEQLIDLCGVDFLTYYNWAGKRFSVVIHLLSVQQNIRLRVRTLLSDDQYPQIASLEKVWSSANWLEREAFDLFGIVFVGHSDLRRLLTDYGFIGHPFRKDFPISGHVEMRYDNVQKRIVYVPVTVVPREVTPRKIRPEHYGDTQ